MVDLERSMIWVPAGIARLGPTALIFSPSIRITAFWIGVALRPSIKCPARIAMSLGASLSAGCWPAQMRLEEQKKKAIIARPKIRFLVFIASPLTDRILLVVLD
jgi:hypothetical protein